MADTANGRGVQAGLTARQSELAVLANLPDAKSSTPVTRTGVLLSDQIELYVTKYKLIDPFAKDQLKPAAYELSVGESYAINGKQRGLSNQVGCNSLTIKPFEVAIIQTRERLNMPNFLIARWNVRVKWAYEGLLWVGGPQVDPGYKGFLFCPIYNLSDKPVTLNYGDPIAIIDFVTTTTPDKTSKSYPSPEKRSRLLLQDYNPSLKSALATMANERLDTFDKTLSQIQSRVDTYTTITFAVLAILFGAIVALAGNNQGLSSEILFFLPFVIVWAFLYLVNRSLSLMQVGAQNQIAAAAKPSNSLLAFSGIGVLILFVVVLSIGIMMELQHNASFNGEIESLRMQSLHQAQQLSGMRRQLDSLSIKARKPHS